MDLRRPRMSGVHAITELGEQAPHVRVLVLTTFDSERDVLPAVEAGAHGYLLKDATPDELVHGVLAVHRGESVLSPAAASHLMGRVRAPRGDCRAAVNGTACGPSGHGAEASHALHRPRVRGLVPYRCHRTRSPVVGRWRPCPTVDRCSTRSWSSSRSVASPA
ncbi:response regulator [Nocardiopsis xinjiangensis]|uniref:response regulator n=1 Tax=Nocardiopsis xinjiangensis TaxID=124285 RepID=UPI00373AED5E